MIIMGCITCILIVLAWLCLFYFLQGTNIISVDSGLEEGHCGLIPIGETCYSCTTTGLTWNLGEYLLENKHFDSCFVASN